MSVDGPTAFTPSENADPAVSAAPLNSPVEVGVRVLMVLTEAYPEKLDVNRLVLLDHGVLHSADLGGPESLHPALPVRAGELSVKRDAVEAGLQLMIRAGLVQMSLAPDGVQFHAGEGAHHFVEILGSTYATTLHERVAWVVRNFDDLSEHSLRRQMRGIFASWSEEFEAPDVSTQERGELS
ncbi:ABC-three component system middle component 2 [Blastococcus sp. SYSU DS0617]